MYKERYLKYAGSIPDASLIDKVSIFYFHYVDEVRNGYRSTKFHKQLNEKYDNIFKDDKCEWRKLSSVCHDAAKDLEFMSYREIELFEGINDEECKDFWQQTYDSSKPNYDEDGYSTYIVDSCMLKERLYWLIENEYI